MPRGDRVDVEFRERCEVDDGALSALHARAFGEPLRHVAWRARLQRHALTWVVAFHGAEIVGFVQVAWDGGVHAFLLDAVVSPTLRRQGIGQRLVTHAAGAASRRGAEWLHVDFEQRLDAFYLGSCGFTPTAAGVLRLGPSEA